MSQDQESVAEHYNFLEELFNEYSEFDIEEISDEDEISERENEEKEEEVKVQEVIVEPREFTEFSVSQAYSQEASKFNKEWNWMQWFQDMLNNLNKLNIINILH